ncbi:uncharacterized protein LOC110447247 [Mizuhopecten yessoensis]|uniref:Uncharacterized protein n=1 Tax=Mizuhopecten yessoensis TaxID=6573 RepID=A0A210QW18_MIZYE|nr:uncharacterized protein LOC110447247 [Mizuhopecten yessoensis]OWF52852.1 hypothetical protein KP79_PYT15033 [Mizuhopecten yessoensis]
MKVPPDVRHMKTASVVLTKLTPTDLPKGVTCNIQQTATCSMVNAAHNARQDSSSSSVSEVPEDAKSRRDVSCTTSYSEEGRAGDIHSHAILDSAEAQKSETASLDTLPFPSADRNMAPPKRDFKHESTKICTSENLPYIESPRKRRKLHFTTSPKNYDAYSQVLPDADIKESNITSNANEQASTSKDKQIGTKGSLNMPTVIEMRFGNHVNEPSCSTIPYIRKKISDTVLGKIQLVNNTAKQMSCNKEFLSSHTESISKALSVKCFDGKTMKNVESSICNDNEQSSKSKACTINRCDVSVKRPTLPHSDKIDCFNQPKSSKKSKTKLENITAKLMREKQEAVNFASTESICLNSSPYSSKIKRETLGTAEYTSIMPMNRQHSADQRGHRARKRPVQKQYLRAGSAINVSLKELIPKERCSSVPSSSENKLNVTRKMLKTAISASTDSIKAKYIPQEDWLQGTQKNVPNILVKSKFATKSKGSSNLEQAATCSKSSTSDQMCKDSSETASVELCRLQKNKSIGNPEILTKIKPKKNRKKQGESFTDELVQPGPSGYRKISGVVVEGNALTETSDKSDHISDTGRISPKKERTSNAVHIKSANAFPHMKELHLPVKGSQMPIIKTSPQKGKRVTSTYKNEIGSDSPISFNFSSKIKTDIPKDTNEVVETTSLPSKSTPSIKPVVQMGSFAISKSQEIIPIKSNESFLTPNTKQNVITPKRVGHAISYAEYCAQMDDAEASHDAAKSKPRWNSEFDVVKVTETQKSDVDIRNNLNDQLRDDANSLLKKLNQLHVNNSKCSEDTKSAQYSDTVGEHDCSEVVIKQEKDEDPIKVDIDDDDDDTASVHLSDHRYTKTPDASPAKPLTKDILHQISTKSGTVAMVNRKQTTEVERKQPVYAVKYGNKLFLIHSKDDKNNGDVKTGTNNPKGVSSFKAISPKIEIKTDKEQTLKDSPNLAKKKTNRKINTGKLVPKRKLDFIRQLVLNQKYLRRKKKQEKQSIYSCRSNRTSVIRNAKVVYITRSNDTIQTTTSRVSITLTKGTDAELKRWSRYADFKAQLTYHDEDNTLIHIKVDELQPGFYKMMPVSDTSDTKTTTVILSCLPPHPDAITEGDAFIAVGPLRNVVDTGEDVKQTEEWSLSQLGKNLISILPSTAMCHGNLYSSDVSYRPKMDAREWYGASVFDIFTRKYCRQKRVLQRRKWDKNPYDKTFN